MPKSAGLSCALGVSVLMPAIETETHFIDEGGAEDVGLVQGKDLPLHAGIVAEAGDGVARCGWAR